MRFLLGWSDVNSRSCPRSRPRFGTPKKINPDDDLNKSWLVGLFSSSRAIENAFSESAFIIARQSIREYIPPSPTGLKAMSNEYHRAPVGLNHIS